VLLCLVLPWVLMTPRLSFPKKKATKRNVQAMEEKPQAHTEPLFTTYTVPPPAASFVAPPQVATAVAVFPPFYAAPAVRATPVHEPPVEQSMTMHDVSRLTVPMEQAVTYAAHQQQTVAPHQTQIVQMSAPAPVPTQVVPILTTVGA